MRRKVRDVREVFKEKKTKVLCPAHIERGILTPLSLERARGRKC